MGGVRFCRDVDFRSRKILDLNFSSSHNGDSQEMFVYALTFARLC